MNYENLKTISKFKKIWKFDAKFQKIPKITNI